MDEELTLIEAGRVGEAEAANEERAKPGYEALAGFLADKGAEYEADARRTHVVASAGTFVAALVAAVVLAVLWWYERVRREGQKALEHLAFHDPLTGLPNRALFVDRLGQALARSERREDRVAVLFMDLYNFKIVNDSLGHEAGDELLAAVAGRLRGCLRVGDTVSRLGGDEFTVLLEDVAEEGEATEVAGRIAR